MSTVSNKRDYTFDILRILACFLVIVNHTISRIATQFFPSPSGYIALLLFYTCKIAVPLFLMISGALLLSKKESYKIVLTKRVLRILVVLFCFSFAYYIFPFLKSRSFSDIHVLSFLKKLVTEPIIIPYWYLYMLVGLLICLPLLRILVQNMSRKDYQYYLIGWFLFACLSVTLLRFFKISISGYFSVPLLAINIGYFVFGHYIQHVFKYPSKKYWNFVALAIIICSILFAVGYSASGYYKTGKLSFDLDSYSYLNVLLPAVSIFYLAKWYIPKIHFPTFIKKALQTIGSATFGIYLLHYPLILYTSSVLEKLCESMNDLLAVIIYEFLIFVVCFFITKLLHLIPYVKKFI